MKTKNYTVIASMGLMLSSLISGFAFVVVKDSLSCITPVWQVALRFCLASLVFVPIFITQGKRPTRRLILQGTVLGIIIFFAFLCSTIGCVFTTASKSAFLTSVYVVVVPLLAWPLYKKAPAPSVFCAAVLCLAGIALLSLPPSFSGIGSVNKGDVYTLIAGIFFALHILAAAHFSRTEAPLMLTAVQTFVTALCALIVAPLLEGRLPIKCIVQLRSIGSLLFLGILSSALCYILQNVGLAYVPPALASLFLSLESLFGALYSVLLLHDVFSPQMMWGAALMFLSVIIAELAPHKKGKPLV